MGRRIETGTSSPYESERRYFQLSEVASQLAVPLESMRYPLVHRYIETLYDSHTLTNDLMQYSRNLHGADVVGYSGAQLLLEAKRLILLGGFGKNPYTYDVLLRNLSGAASYYDLRIETNESPQSSHGTATGVWQYPDKLKRYFPVPHDPTKPPGWWRQRPTSEDVLATVKIDRLIQIARDNAITPGHINPIRLVQMLELQNLSQDAEAAQTYPDVPGLFPSAKERLKRGQQLDTLAAQMIADTMRKPQLSDMKFAALLAPAVNPMGIMIRPRH